MNASVDRGQIWLRGNLRPAAGLLLGSAVVTGTGLAVAAIAGAPTLVIGVLAGAGAAAVAAAGLIAAAAARPRLELHGAAVRVRLAPLAVHDVPLDVVECVFLGSQRLDAEAEAAETDAGRRVTTLVMRIAERATDWRSRPTTAWGTWEDGNVVFDGRWCEPLTVELARDVARRLLEAKRAHGPVAETPAGCGR